MAERLSKYEQAARRNQQTLANRYGRVDYTAPSSVPAPAPAPTWDSPSIEDSQYRAYVDLATKNRDQRLAAIAGSAQQLRLNYGYLDDLKTIDPNNPFGQAQLLKRNYDQTRAGTQNSYAARGQQTSGAYQRMQGANLFGYQQRDDALQKSYDQARADLINQAIGVGTEYGDSTIGARGDALQRAIANRQGAYQTNASQGQNDPIVNVYYDKNGNKVNVHQSGRKATIKK